MTFPRAVTLFGCAVGALLFGAPDASAQGLDRDPEGFLIARPEDTRPTEGGGRSVRIYEDAETGLYVTQITWPPGTGSRPHFHDQDRHIHVMKGTWWVATGEAAEVYDPDSTIPVGPGTFIYEPAGGVHYDMAKDEEVVVQIWGFGPVNTTSVPKP